MDGRHRRHSRSGPNAIKPDPMRNTQVMEQAPSPNFGPRRGCDCPDMVILHFTGMDDLDAARTRLCDPVPEVSAHYIVGRDGRVIQLVAEANRAWHAGKSHWAGWDDINSRSIGIELDYPGSLRNYPPYPEPQMSALEALLGDISARHQILPANVLGHSDIAPSRKPDPGPKFDWTRLARRGLAETTPKPVAGIGFLAAMKRIGYDPDAREADLLSAFRLRWRQAAIGTPQDGIDDALATALAARRAAWPDKSGRMPTDD